MLISCEQVVAGKLCLDFFYRCSVEKMFKNALQSPFHTRSVNHLSLSFTLRHPGIHLLLIYTPYSPHLHLPSQNGSHSLSPYPFPLFLSFLPSSLPSPSPIIIPPTLTPPNPNPQKPPRTPQVPPSSLLPHNQHISMHPRNPRTIRCAATAPVFVCFCFCSHGPVSVSISVSVLVLEVLVFGFWF